MVFFQFIIPETSTIFMVFCVQGSLFVIFLIFAYKIMKRNRNRISITLSGFYLNIAAGFFINFIFIFIMYNTLLYQFLFYLTIYLIFLGAFFLILFTLLMIKTEIIITVKSQLSILIVYSILLLILFIINGLNTDLNSTVYTLPFVISLVTIVTISTVIPVIYCSIKIYKSITNEILKKRWIMFMIGSIELLFTALGTVIYYYFSKGETSFEWGIVAFILMINSSFLIYYGVHRRL